VSDDRDDGAGRKGKSALTFATTVIKTIRDVNDLVRIR